MGNKFDIKEKFLKFKDRISDFYKGLESKNKKKLFSVIGGIILLAVIITVVLNHKSYAVLYEGIDSKQAQEIVSIIEAKEIEVNYTNGGKITVPKDKVDELTMDLAVEGYPKDGLNYDIFNNNIDMFTTDYEAREQAKMQLQERLAATIRQLQPIQDAVVTLEIPEQKNTVLNSDKQPPKAWAKITLKNNTSLSDNQLEGIKHLLLMSVSGLTEDNVAIVDNDGNLLEEGNATSEDTITIEKKKLLFKQEYQETIKQEIMSLLADGYGEDNIKIAVNANLNYNKEVSEDTTYTPSHNDGSGMVQQQDTQTSNGKDGTPGGTVGTDPNADDTYPTESEDDGNIWNSSSTSTSYLINTLKKQTEKQGYYVDDLTVSIILYIDNLNDTTRENLTTAVAKATSINEEYVSVINLPRINDDTSVLSETGYPFGFSEAQFIALLAGLLMLMVIVFALYINVSSKAKKKRILVDMAAVAKASKEGEKGKVKGHFNVPEEEDFNLKSLTKEPKKETKEQAIKREIGEFSKTNPEIVAQLLRSWLREEEQNGGNNKNSRR